MSRVRLTTGRLSLEAQPFVQDQHLALQCWTFVRETEELMLMTVERVASLAFQAAEREAMITSPIKPVENETISKISPMR